MRRSDRSRFGRRYDTGAMDRPAPEEIARALKALGLGAALGLALRLIGRVRSQR
jgi:signal recognition particle subunit SEC65